MPLVKEWGVETPKGGGAGVLFLLPTVPDKLELGLLSKSNASPLSRRAGKRRHNYSAAWIRCLLNDL
jgi:hypothetical protein